MQLFDLLLILFALITVVLFVRFVKTVRAFRSTPAEEDSESRLEIQQMLDKHLQAENGSKDLTDEKT